MLNHGDFENVVNNKCEATNKICTAMDVVCKSQATGEFCAATGESYKLWKETNLYLYNATGEYSAMNEAVQKWLDDRESTEMGGASDRLECGVTNMQLQVTWVNEDLAANATVFALGVSSNTALRLEPDIEVPLVLPPGGNYTFNTNATVHLNAPVNVIINITEGAAVSVSIQIDGVSVDTTEDVGYFEHETEFDVCENVTDGKIATIQSPAAFEGAHTVLKEYLCSYD